MEAAAEESLGGAAASSLRSKRKGAMEIGSGVSPGQGAAAHFSPGCKTPGVLQSLGDAGLRGEKRGRERPSCASPKGGAFSVLSYIE